MGSILGFNEGVLVVGSMLGFNKVRGWTGRVQVRFCNGVGLF